MLKKKTIKKKTKRPLVTAEGQLAFWVHDGPVLADMRDLRDALKSMSDKTFEYHVSGAKNDFANWVRAVLSDPDLAKKLMLAKKRTAAAKIVADHLRAHY